MENKIEWSRRELKERSKSVLRIHYWRIILVTLILLLLAGSDQIPLNTADTVVQNQADSILTGGDSAAHSFKLTTAYKLIKNQFLENQYLGNVGLGMAAAAALILSGIVSLSGILLTVFVTNPLQVGSLRFYNRAFDTNPRFRELFHVFEYKYRNVVGIMFLKDLYTLLWCFLFVIPGIVKSYEYCMIPYLLSEHSDMQAKEAFAASRQLMQGQKWKAFVLDLSFLGWMILSGLTFGILGIFFVYPYKELTRTALYRKLLGGDVIPHNIYYDGMEEEEERGWYNPVKE